MRIQTNELPTNYRARVLIAEDSLVLGEVLRFNLERAGFDVDLASNGRDAIDMLRSESYSLFITDYEMPIWNGEQICEYLRTELGLHNLPIVMCSAKGLELDYERLRSTYCIAALLQKPFSMNELTDIAKRLVNTASLASVSS